MILAVVLVTGGAGYIGSHTCQALLDAGHRPIVFDNFSTGFRKLLVTDELLEGDLCRGEDIRKAFHSFPVDAVIHFASHCSVGESYENPFKYYHDNLVNALHLLEAMRSTGVRKIIFSSTCATYGIPLEIPIPEEHPTNPINAYGHSKRCIEWMLEDYQRAHGFEFVALRYFNASGADPQGRLGECHDPETHLIPRIFMATVGHIPALEVFGEDYPTPDGTCVRDYIHVSDLAAAHVAALQRLLSCGRGGFFNLGTGEGYSVRQLLNEAERVTGCRTPVRFGPRRLGDPPALLAKSQAALRELSWVPKHSSLPVILETAWRWFQKTSQD
jgi:UDP-arabinose 4-epimerase